MTVAENVTVNAATERSLLAEVAAELGTSVQTAATDENGMETALKALASGIVPEIALDTDAAGRIKAARVSHLEDDATTKRVIDNYKRFVGAMDDIDMMEAAGFDVSKLSKTLRTSKFDEYVARLTARLMAIAWEEVNTKLSEEPTMKTVEAQLLVRKAFDQMATNLKP